MSSEESSTWKELNRYVSGSGNKYVYAAAALATIGGCYLIYKAYEQQQDGKQTEYDSVPARDNNDNEEDSKLESSSLYKDDYAMTSLASGSQRIDPFSFENFKSMSGISGSSSSSSDDNNTNNNGSSSSFPIQVFVRIRPMVGKEIKENHEKLDYQLKQESKKKSKSKLSFKKNNNNNNTKNENGETEEILTIKNVGGRLMKDSKSYKGFENVLLPIHNNYDTFNTCILPYLGNILNGESTCVFAYGHTGSGKTHTIFGYGNQHPGMYQLYSRSLFDYINKTKAEKNLDLMLEIRFTELYNGKLRDLLSPTKEECFVRENNDGQVFIRSDPKKSEKDGKVRQFPITGIACNNEDTLMKIVNDGVRSRNVGLSTLHDKSSRSHAFLEYEIVNKELIQLRNELVEMEADKLTFELSLKDSEAKKCGKKIEEILKNIKNVMNKEICIGGTMVFVDLAGNEYGRDVEALQADEDNENNDENSGNGSGNGMTDEEKERLKEEKKKQFLQEQKERNEINQSLLALKECIRALHSNKKHVPYRDSKLTLYLSQYLKGNTSQAIMISNIGSSKKYSKQTINTLKYTQLVAQA